MIDRPKRTQGDLWFLSVLGLFEIAIGYKTQGLSDLKQAYACQEDDWAQPNTNYTNNFYYLNSRGGLLYLQAARQRYFQ